MQKYNIPADHVIRHYDVTGKICPNPYVMDEEKWIQFKTAIGATQQEPRWVKDDKGWWYQNADGTWPKSEWRLINHHRYLFGADGYIKTGWHRWNPSKQRVDPDDGSGDWYYLQETGDLEGACWHGTEKGSLEIWYIKQKLFLILVYYLSTIPDKKEENMLEDNKSIDLKNGLKPHFFAHYEIRGLQK